MMAFYIGSNMADIPSAVHEELRWLADNGVAYRFRHINEGYGALHLVFDDDARGTQFLVRFPHEQEFLLDDARAPDEYMRAYP